jgi:excisionase family DNA binding protein
MTNQSELDYRDPEWVAQRLGLDKNTVYKYLQDGTLPGLQLGRKWLVSERRLVEFLDDADRRQTRQRRNAAGARIPLLADGLLTDGAQTAIDVARDEARALNHEHVGTEHLIVALIRDPAAAPSQLLTALGVDIEALLTSARSAVEPGPPLTATAVVFTPRIRQVLSLALEESRAFGDTQVAPEHLLLGLLAAGEGMAYTVLTRAGVTLEAARAVVRERTT